MVYFSICLKLLTCLVILQSYWFFSNFAKLLVYKFTVTYINHVKTYFNEAPCVSENRKQTISTAIANVILAVYWTTQLLNGNVI